MQGVDLDAEIRQVDPDRWFASRFIADDRARAQVVVLYAFDHELSRAEGVTSNPLAAEIRLGWWREALDDIHANRGARLHPVAEALAGIVRAKSLPRDLFESMIEVRIAAIGKAEFDPDAALIWSRDTQGVLARLAALVLGSDGDGALAAPAGAVWGLVLLRRAGKAGGKVFDAQLRETLIDAMRAASGLSPAVLPAALCATLARADLRSNSPSELEKRLRLFWAALTGRL